MLWMSTFRNMNFSILLILLSVIRLGSCTRGNITDDESYNVCTLSYFRRKRANTDYTRWYANQETKQEFIVKVLEDDISIPERKQIAAVNIQPITKGQEKIIIRGAFVPASKESTLDLLKDYTRFVPPTTLVVANDNGNTPLSPIKPIVEEITPIRLRGTEIIYGPVRNSQPDISSLTSSQFLQKSQTLVARQYAPIAPVSFTWRITVGPLTPRTVDKFMMLKTTVRPTRTTSYSDKFVPMRTSELVSFLPFKYNAVFNKVAVSRSSLSSVHIERTSLLEETSTEKLTEKLFRKDNSFHEIQSNKIVNKEVDIYSDFFYNDDESTESKTRKSEIFFIENYEDTNKTNNDHINLENDVNSTENSNELKKLKKYTNELSFLNYEDEDEIDNTTVSCASKTDTKAVVTTQAAKILKPVKRKLICTVVKLRQLSFSSPLTLHEIVTQLKQWAEESPVAKWVDITKKNYTVMENPIYMMIVDDPSSGQIVTAKQTVMIVAGILGRDHHAVTAAMYILFQLIERSDAHSELLTKYRFWIIPVFNPDGYDYSMTFPHRREWAKNLRQTWDSCKGRDSCQACLDFGIRCTIQPCYGVNLDRNFEYQWIPPEELQTEHPCGNLYAGPRQLSEAETHALTHFLHDQRTPLYTFLAFKEGDVLGVMYPYSHTRKKRAFDHVYRQRASQAASAAYSISGRPYVAGQTSEFLPLYAGGIEDWVDGHLGIDNTYTIMMFRPTDSQNSKLVTERVVHEAYAAVDTLLLQSEEPLGPPPITLTRATASDSALPSIILICLVIIVIYGYG